MILFLLVAFFVVDAQILHEKKKCQGAEIGCKTRKCKSIYVCCVEKKGLEFCHQCKSYPCSRYREFAERWKKHGQDLLANQQYIAEFGKKEFIDKMKTSC